MGASAAFHGLYQIVETIVETVDMQDMSHRLRNDEIEHMRIKYKYIYIFFRI